MIVSVVMITYGHAPFIADAIQGVLMQVTNSEIELIIADDCSPDNTSEIVNAIINENKKAKEVIRYTRHEKNKGMMPNLSWAIKQAKGKYMAFCEGDDYWTDPNKLQMQVEFLEHNLEYSGTCHNVLIKNMNDEALGYFHAETSNSIFSLKDIIQNGVVTKINTTSMFIRSQFIQREIDENFEKLPFGDLPISILVAKYGPFYYFSNVMSVYRKHSGGFTSNFNWSTYAQDYDMFYAYINHKLGNKYNGLITKIIKHIFLDSVNVNLGKGDMDVAKGSMQRLYELINLKDCINYKYIKTIIKYKLYCLIK